MIVFQADSYPKIAVLLTCFNRRDKTLFCLRSLELQTTKYEIFLVDDSSTDGTSESVKTQFPNVHLIKGDGNLFWNRGMHLAWTNALSKDFDFYLLLNDDVLLLDNSVELLFYDSSQCNHSAIISGAVSIPDSNIASYGGISISTGKLAQPDNTLQPIRNLNGNVVFVPKSVVDKIGILDPFYHHHFGDVDYGMVAHENNVGVFLSTKFVGECPKNPICRIRSSRKSLSKRFQILFSPLGTPPSSIYHLFRKHKKTFHGVLFIVYLIIINLFPDWLYSFCFGKD